MEILLHFECGNCQVRPIDPCPYVKRDQKRQEPPAYPPQSVSSQLVLFDRECRVKLLGGHKQEVFLDHALTIARDPIAERADRASAWMRPTSVSRSPRS